MASIIDEHYESSFEFPLWALIRRCASESDISYCAAYARVLSEYEKTIRYDDTEGLETEIRRWNQELAKLFAERAED